MTGVTRVTWMTKMSGTTELAWITRVSRMTGILKLDGQDEWDDLIFNEEALKRFDTLWDLENCVYLWKNSQQNVVVLYKLRKFKKRKKLIP